MNSTSRTTPVRITGLLISAAENHPQEPAISPGSKQQTKKIRAVKQLNLCWISDYVAEK
tara:strand:- start:326 stop:502 length:177 start_codon:yes stop_codon:yes gene_type:complete